MRFCGADNCEQPVFGTDKNTSIGYCKGHQYKRTDLDKRSIVQKAMEKHKDQKQAHSKEVTKIRGLAKPANNDDKVKLAEMQLFWMMAEKELEKDPHCMECGAFIPKSFFKKLENGQQKISINGYRAATAHVLPKRKE